MERELADHRRLKIPAEINWEKEQKGRRNEGKEGLCGRGDRRPWERDKEGFEVNNRKNTNKNDEWSAMEGVQGGGAAAWAPKVRLAMVQVPTVVLNCLVVANLVTIRLATTEAESWMVTMRG